MSSTSTPRVTHQGSNTYVQPAPQTLLEASVPPPQYPIDVNRLPQNPAPAMYPVDRLNVERQYYPVVVENPTLWQCYKSLRARDILEFGSLGGFILGSLYFNSIVGRKVVWTPVVLGGVAIAGFYPYLLWHRSFYRLTGTFENEAEQRKFGMDTSNSRTVSKIVRKRVFQSKEDDPEFMDTYLKRVDNESYQDMRAYLASAMEIQIRLEKDGLTLEDFTRYPSEALSDPQQRTLYQTVVGNTPDLQKFFIQHPEAVKVLRENPWALQEYEHGNRFLAKLYRIWTAPTKVQDFLQAKPAYITNFMYNKLTWDDVEDFAEDWKENRL